MLDALKLKGGGEKGLAKEAVAALLNSRSVNYTFTTSQVIQIVQDAYRAADDDDDNEKDIFNDAKDILKDANKQECPFE